MSTRNDRFNAAMLSIEDLVGERDPSEVDVFTDNGQANERMDNEIDINVFGIQPDPDYVPRESCPSCDSCGNCQPCPLANVISALIADGKGYLVPTLLLIVQNGGNREASIREIMIYRKISYKRAWNVYFEHRKLLLTKAHRG